MGCASGPCDRPSVYRALAQLEADHLVEAWSDAPVAGSMRRVYGLTDDGRARAASLDGGREGGARRPRSSPAAVRGDGHRRCPPRRGRERRSSPSAARRGRRCRPRPRTTSGPDSSIPKPVPMRCGPPRPGPDPGRPVPVPPGRRTAPRCSSRPARRSVRSASVRSGSTGVVEVEFADGEHRRLTTGPSARVEIPVGDLRSGNRLYDAELLRRIDVEAVPERRPRPRRLHRPRGRQPLPRRRHRDPARRDPSTRGNSGGHRRERRRPDRLGRAASSTSATSASSRRRS